MEATGASVLKKTGIRRALEDVASCVLDSFGACCTTWWKTVEL